MRTVFFTELRNKKGMVSGRKSGGSKGLGKWIRRVGGKCRINHSTHVELKNHMSKYLLKTLILN